MKFAFHHDWQHQTGKPNYRYFKLVFTVALRLGIAIEMKAPLVIDVAGRPTAEPRYKSRTNYLGTLTINGVPHENMVYVIDTGYESPELVTFWKNGQRADQVGTKGGAHPFAELYIGYVLGRTVERKTFNAQAVAALSSDYNLDPKFNIQAWIVNNVPADAIEPPRTTEPVENPRANTEHEEQFPELNLINKWRTDVLGLGAPYMNYEVDACVRRVTWNSSDERISLDVHWEDGKYVSVKDFGRFDRYVHAPGRQRVLKYLQQYDGESSRSRLILTVRSDSVDWMLASATMLKRLPHLI